MGWGGVGGASGQQGWAWQLACGTRLEAPGEGQVLVVLAEGARGERGATGRAYDRPAQQARGRQQRLPHALVSVTLTVHSRPVVQARLRVLR